MSYHYMMIYTTFKSTYTKLEPTVLRQQQYKSFSKESFLKDVKFGLSNDGIFSHFNIKPICTYKTHKTSWKHKTFVNNTLRKELMKKILTKK